MKKNNRKGFTIVELVIVIAVIAILAGVLIPTFSGVVKKAKENAALQEAKNEYTNVYAIALSNDGIIDTKDTDTTANITVAESGTGHTITTAKYVFTFDANGILTGAVDKLGASDAAKFTYDVVDGVIKSAKTIK